MTNEEILSLPAGPDLDLRVAEVVLGQVWQGGNPIPGYHGRWPWPYPYSTNLLAAWEVVETLMDDGAGFELEGDPELGWDAWFSGGVRGQGTGETAPLAICRAALLMYWPAPAGGGEGVGGE